MFAASLHLSWTKLPLRSPQYGSVNKSRVCTGCEEQFSLQLPLGYKCDFRLVGFPFADGKLARPCGTAYHGKCIRAGPPFRTRLPNGKGLCFPHNVPIPHFICECCQVRALLNRELDSTYRDVALLILGRMRMIDVISNWRTTTLGQYAPALRSLQAFEKWSGVPTLVPTVLTRPPTGAIYGIMYAQLRSTLPKPGHDEGIKYNSSRKLRSAASMWYNLDMQMCYPSQAVRDQQRRCYLTVQTTPSDALAFTFLNTGMARRMGDATQPSWTLNHAHIAFIDRRLEELWCGAVTAVGRHELATAACANLVAWFGWLRGGELFGISRVDVTVTEPAHGVVLGLPQGVGVIQVRLAPETKSNPTRTADVVIAYCSGSGLSLGKWMDRVLSTQRGALLFSTESRQRWNSSYFRHEYAFPLLEEMRAAGEPTLQVFSDVEGHRIKDKVWSMHSWRRGGRSKVTRSPREGDLVPGGWRKATLDEVNEHGRWRTRFHSETMAVHYNDWELVDRVMLTLLCM
jgi:hypothetical protein